jgi:kinetochore protein Mis13/DSN1
MAGFQVDLDMASALRGDDELVPLAESETPMIRKNKEMREAQSSRRSSLDTRGQRASSSLGRGDPSTSLLGIV